MDTTSVRARLVEPTDLDEEFRAITATIPRSEVEAALSSELRPELYLDVRRPGAAEAEERTVAVAWEKDDLERLLDGARQDAITFSFAYDELERAFDAPDVEAHGFRERALVLTVAAVAATGAGAAGAAAGIDGGTGATTTAAAAQVTHGEAATASTLVQPPANDEAGLSSRGIQVGAVHDEATLASRGIEAPPAVHDEATLIARGIDVPEVAATHDEATLIARGIQPTPLPDGGSGFEFPTIDAPTAAITGGIAGGIALLITAAGFSARRGRGPRPA
jgi:hypothetical protein